jgi:hypothetical protein
MSYLSTKLYCTCTNKTAINIWDTIVSYLHYQWKFGCGSAITLYHEATLAHFFVLGNDLFRRFASADQRPNILSMTLYLKYIIIISV